MSTASQKCKWGMICYKLRDKAHSKDFSHEPAICRHGNRCAELDNPKHCYTFSHPNQALILGLRKVDVKDVPCDWCHTLGAPYMLSLYSKYPSGDNYDNVCEACLISWEQTRNNGQILHVP